MTATQQEERESKGLRAGAMGLVGSVVVGIASTAPAYSLAASLGYVVIVQNGNGIVGVKAPLIMVLAFIPMYFIAVAYSELNKAEPDCGTTFTWAARAFGTKTGWMGGWGIIAADVIVMANLSQIAGSYSFALFGFDSLAASKFWSTVAGIIWIAIMTYICYRGIEVSVRLQYALLGVEVVDPGRVRAVRAREGVRRTTRPRHQAVARLALAERVEPDGDRERHPDRGVHLLGLGHRRRDQRGVRRPGQDPGTARRSSRRSCCC